jgi:hypothetical protein
MFYTANIDNYDSKNNDAFVFTSHDMFFDPTREARRYKILSHQFTDEWSLWVDSSVILKKPVEEIIKKYQDKDLVVFKSRYTNCVYQEAGIIKELKLDNPELIDRQMEKYKKAGLPEEIGLSTTTCVFRRHTKKIIEFNNMWWAELSAFSKRDQLSIDYCLWTLGITPNYFDGTLFDSPDFTYTEHIKRRSTV